MMISSENAGKVSEEGNFQGLIQRSFATAEPVWDPKFLSQIN